MAANLPTNPSLIATGRGRDQIYVATTPLRATKGPAQLVMSAAYSLNLWDLHHFMLIIKPATSTSVSPLSNSQATVFDFQPQDPENIFVALAALSGRPIPGTVLVRNISKLPKKKCWHIGSSNMSNAIEAAYEFNSSWKTDLRIELAEILTGERNVLERLRQESTKKVML